MTISKGSKIKLDYEGKLENGEVFDSSTHGDHSHPLEFEVGSGKVIKGFDEAVIGMNEGEEKEFSIEPAEAYGERNEALKREVPKESVQVGRELEKGMTLVMQTPQGNVPVNILEVGDKTVTLDLNHPLAGKKLMFKIKVLEVNG